MYHQLNENNTNIFHAKPVFRNIYISLFCNTYDANPIQCSKEGKGRKEIYTDLGIIVLKGALWLHGSHYHMIVWFT